jgi:hypothetical protein
MDTDGVLGKTELAASLRPSSWRHVAVHLRTGCQSSGEDLNYQSVLRFDTLLVRLKFQNFGLQLSCACHTVTKLGYYYSAICGRISSQPSGKA